MDLACCEGELLVLIRPKYYFHTDLVTFYFRHDSWFLIDKEPYKYTEKINVFYGVLRFIF